MSRGRLPMLLLPILLTSGIVAATALFAASDEVPPAALVAEPPVTRTGSSDREDPAPTVVARAHLVRATDLRYRGDYAAGMTAARTGLALATAAGADALRAELLYIIARIQWNLTDYAASVETHLEQLRLGEALQDPAILALAHNGLGITRRSLGDDAPARTHHETSLRYAEQTTDADLIATALNSFGNYHLDRRHYDAARDLYTRALRLREQTGNDRGIADASNNLGLIAEETGDSTTALSLLERALAIYTRSDLKRYVANTHRRMGRVLRSLGRYDEAIAQLETSLRLAAPLGSNEVLANIHREFALTHEARGDLASALAHQRRLATTLEAARGERDRQRIAELQARYDAERRDLEIDLLRRDQALQAAEIRRRHLQSIALAATLLLGLGLAGAIIALLRTRLRATRRLHAATEEARRRAEAAERLKTRLLQIASHDLKTPLAAIAASAGRLRDAAGDAALVARVAAGVQADTSRMGSLVRDFLDTAALEDGRLAFDRSPLDLATLATAVVESLQPLAAAKHQRLSLSLPAAPLPLVEADASRLRQVFDNLVANALKFTPPGGAVEVVLGESGGGLCAEVRDTGPGLQPEDFVRLFTPHTRLSAVPTGGESSTGLGLSITRELLTRQGGRLEVESQPGQGAVFRVLLPAAAVAPPR